MCGIVGLVSQSAVNQTIYDALTVLQHRGQDAAGIVTCTPDNRLFLRKSNGLVKDVFRNRHMRRLQGHAGIGHVRYPTSGTASQAEAQPLYVNSPYGITMAHNGNLTNNEQLSKELYQQDLRHINTSLDSEVLINVLAHELQALDKKDLSPDDIFTAVGQLFKRCKGAYAAVAFIVGHGLVALRDPYGIRPIIYGTKKTAEGVDVMVASESVALSALGFEIERDLAPGEAIFVSLDGKVHTKQCIQTDVHAPCIFEYVYLARPDSVIDGVSVYNAHIRMGAKLAKKIEQLGLTEKIDVVIPIPDTSRPIALELSQTLGLKYREGFIKNRYIGRTFIMPGQKERKKSVRQKLNVINSEFEGLNVLLVDDSIVRGTTSKQIIQMARDAGAKQVFFASAAPPVRFPNVYGIDMASANELIAHNHEVDAISQLIGADQVVYQELQDLEDCIKEQNPVLTEFDTSVFNGCYITKDIDQAYLDALDKKRSDSAKQKSQSSGIDDESSIDLHNAS